MSSTRLEALLQISDTIAGVRDLKDLLHLLANPLRQAVSFEYVAVILKESAPDGSDMMRLYTIETSAESRQLPPNALARRHTFRRVRADAATLDTRRRCGDSVSSSCRCAKKDRDQVVLLSPADNSPS